MVVVYDTETNIIFNIQQPFRDVLQISKSENVQKPPATGRTPTVPPQELKTYSFEKIKVHCSYFPRNLFFTISFL